MGVLRPSPAPSTIHGAHATPGAYRGRARGGRCVFQEVRLDSSFRISGTDAGSQVDHLRYFLAEAEKDSGTCTSDGRGCTLWNVVYQPAMSAVVDKNKVRSRHEEGLAIFSRLPLRQPAFLLLPRDLTKSSDDHNRAVLAASVSLPLAGAEEGDQRSGIDDISFQPRRGRRGEGRVIPVPPRSLPRGRPRSSAATSTATPKSTSCACCVVLRHRGG